VRSAPSTSTYLALTGTTFAFGLSFVATKYGLRGFEPLLLALLRFTLAGGILWLMWRVFGAREQATRAELGRLAALGFVSLTVYFSFENSGIARTSASQAAILMAAVPIFVVILNLFTLREHNSGRQWAGVGLSFVGIVGLVLLGGGSGGGSMTGNLLVLVASVAAAAYTLLARHMLVKRSALFVTTFQNLFGALFMLPLALIEALLFGVRRPAWTSVGALAYLAVICSVLGYLLLNYALGYVEASKASVFLNLIPVVGVAGAYLLLGERFTPGQAVAAAVVVFGVWLTNSGRRTPVVPAAA
jgi:drug/metabolite transporter (DMT)-like permease